MASLKQFKLPDVGEGLAEAEIVRWHVSPGDAVAQNQTIVDIETAKALVELPCPFSGVVREILVTEGSTVDVGTPIIIVDVEPSDAVTPTPRHVPADAGDGGSSGSRGSGGSGGSGSGGSSGGSASSGSSASSGHERQPNLVGYGPLDDAPTRRRQRHVTAVPPVTPSSEPSWPSVAPAAAAPRNGARADSTAAAESTAPAEPGVGVLAKPPVRKLARDLGIDLHSVHGSGPDGTITRSDVEAAADTSREGGLVRPFPRGGEERIPIRGVRKAIAQAMVTSVFTVPHVTEFTTIDVTQTMRAVARLRELPDFADVKVSPLLLVAKAVLLAIERYPMVNSEWDSRNEEIVVKHYVNLGIAAATPRGLVVPNIKHAEALSLAQLAHSLNALAITARAGHTSVGDMQHGTFTITNVGVFGIDTGTPVINPGEAAILALGAIREQPWVHRGRVRPRSVTTLALSFDHRIVDGELGSLFLRDVARFLEDPASALLARL